MAQPGRLTARLCTAFAGGLLRKQEEQTRRDTGLNGAGISIERNLVPLVRGPFTGPIVTQRVDLFANWVDRRLIRKQNQLRAESMDGNKRLQQLVMHVSVPFQRCVQKSNGSNFLFLNSDSVCREHVQKRV